MSSSTNRLPPSLIAVILLALVGLLVAIPGPTGYLNFPLSENAGDAAILWTIFLVKAVAGIPALWLGLHHVRRHRADRAAEGSRGGAWAALVLGAMCLLWALAYVVIMVGMGCLSPPFGACGND